MTDVRPSLSQLFELLNREAGRFDGLDDVMEFAATKLIFVVFALAAVLGVEPMAPHPASSG